MAIGRPSPVPCSADLMAFDPWPNEASNAPFKVYDGSTLLATVTVNQKANPAGTQIGTSVFQSLGNFTIASGTLKVVLSNNANGYVIADALRVAMPPNTTVDMNWTGGSLTGPSTTDTQ